GGRGRARGRHGVAGVPQPRLRGDEAVAGRAGHLRRPERLRTEAAPRARLHLPRHRPRNSPVKPGEWTEAEVGTRLTRPARVETVALRRAQFRRQLLEHLTFEWV